MAKFDPDPLGMGLVPAIHCVACGRDRYGEATSTEDEDIISGETGSVDFAIRNVNCSCGEKRIRVTWLTGDPGDGYSI